MEVAVRGGRVQRVATREDLDSSGGVALSVYVCVRSKAIKQRWLQSGEWSWRCAASLQLLALKLKQQY